MSEQLLPSGEKKVELLDVSAESRQNLERIQATPEVESKPDLAEIQAKIEQHAISREQVAPSLQEQTHDDAPIGTVAALKAESYRRTINRLQSRLKGPSRTFSHVIHQPTVEMISNTSSRT